MELRGLFALAVALLSTTAVHAQSTKRPQPPPQVLHWSRLRQLTDGALG